VIAPAAAADLPDLASLMAASALLRRYHIDQSAALQSLTSAFENGDLLLLSREHGPSGLAWVTFAPRALDGAAYLRLLLVAEGARNTGTGARLLTAVEDRARARANHIYLLATTDNTAARRFYERHGYRHIGDLPGLVRPEVDEALYHKPLRSYAERFH
jgi:GNAT superfamily N-acetyltransferase